MEILTKKPEIGEPGSVDGDTDDKGETSIPRSSRSVIIVEGSEVS